MEKIKIFIDDVEYLVNDIDTIYNTCKNLGIDVPTLYLENDISYVVVNDQHVDATKELISSDIRIYINHDATSEDEKNRICNLYNMTKHNCTLCPAINCKLSKMYDKYGLNKEKEDTYLNCAYFKKGVKTHVLNLVYSLNNLPSSNRIYVVFFYLDSHIHIPGHLPSKKNH